MMPYGAPRAIAYGAALWSGRLVPTLKTQDSRLKTQLPEPWKEIYGILPHPVNAPTNASRTVRYCSIEAHTRPL
ncbi:MAG: hypothetical protein K2H38_03315 [Muribaculaceae bacterium]|nr:hypothetical protein [Muribaculaceae bacterium]